MTRDTISERSDELGAARAGWPVQINWEARDNSAAECICDEQAIVISRSLICRQAVHAVLICYRDVIWERETERDGEGESVVGVSFSTSNCQR